MLFLQTEALPAQELTDEGQESGLLCHDSLVISRWNVIDSVGDSKGRQVINMARAGRALDW